MQGIPYGFSCLLFWCRAESPWVSVVIEVSIQMPFQCPYLPLSRYLGGSIAGLLRHLSPTTSLLDSGTDLCHRFLVQCDFVLRVSELGQDYRLARVVRTVDSPRLILCNR
jgi:hypothetical protein